MNCPSCNSPLEPNARFCGVCGYRLQPTRPAPLQGSSPAIVAGTPGARKGAASPVAGARAVPAEGSAVGAAPRPGAGGAGAARPAAQKAGGPEKQRLKSKPKPEDIYLNQVLNNRFRVESKIGEGGFGAVYRGVQLATGRKVALKLLHPEMTKDENLVARFRREGMVLCNLRDAHTITTYDFDQTPDGTLYIAMELLEGKSLHQLFHDQAPLEWKRMFKILSEMCSSLAEAHAQGIVHRDLKPENVYLESRPGNPEFVKILDFGIAKVMRGDSIDPQSPQLTATGQTLGTLEYMSPEQLMGKPLDGRSDVYALGVVAYEMITGRLPFPEAKGPAGLITAQLKQTPQPPSAANAKIQLPPDADRVILKCLEKDKNNRYPDVSALSAALQEVISDHLNQSGERSVSAVTTRPPPDLVEARRPPRDQGEARRPPRDQSEAGREPLKRLQPAPAPQAIAAPPGGGLRPAPIPQTPVTTAVGGHGQAGAPLVPAPQPPKLAPQPSPGLAQGQSGLTPMPPAGGFGAPAHGHSGLTPMPPYNAPIHGQSGLTPMPPAGFAPPAPYPPQAAAPYPAAPRRSISWIWWLVGLLVLGAGFGALVAVLVS